MTDYAPAAGYVMIVVSGAWFALAGLARLASFVRSGRWRGIQRPERTPPATTAPRPVSRPYIRAQRDARVESGAVVVGPSDFSAFTDD